MTRAAQVIHFAPSTMTSSRSAFSPNADPWTLFAWHAYNQEFLVISPLHSLSCVVVLQNSHVHRLVLLTSFLLDY